MKKIDAIEKKCPELFKVYSPEHGLPVHFACSEGAPVEVVGRLLIVLPATVNIELPFFGLPLGCANDIHSFSLLLGIHMRLFGKQKNGTPAFHTLLLDDTLEVKDPIISRFVEFSQLESRTEEFQEDLWTKDKRTGTYPLHLAFGAISHMQKAEYPWLDKNKGLLTDLINCYPQALEERDNRGWLPVHHALRHNAPLEIIRLLVDRYPGGLQGADVQGSTLLHLVCRYGSSEAVLKYLVEQGDEITFSPDNDGRTPLHVACRHGKVNVQANHHLKDSNRTVFTMTDNNGCTPLHVASRHGIYHPNVLVGNQALELAMRDNRGELPIHKACRGAPMWFIRELVLMKPHTVSVRNSMNELPLFILCKRSVDKELRESVEYTETIWMMLLAHPETVSI